MVAFTISDYSYTYDMVHDVYQMMEAVVGFDSLRNFFLLAIDRKTVDVACRYGYPVVYWNADEGLRDAVANTKVNRAMNSMSSCPCLRTKTNMVGSHVLFFAFPAPLVISS
jgi:hypothetical protein